MLEVSPPVSTCSALFAAELSSLLLQAGGYALPLDAAISDLLRDGDRVTVARCVHRLSQPSCKCTHLVNTA